MSEFSYPPNTTKKTNLFSLLLSDLFLLCSFIISHPLYLSYFIFFSPYIIKILSFLSPLFITTSLLLLALFTTFVHDTCCTTTQLSEKSNVSFLLSAYHKLRSNVDDVQNGKSYHFEDLEVYKIVFDTCISTSSSSSVEIREDEVSEAPIDKHLCCESLAEIMKSESDQSCQLIAEVKSLGGFLEEDHDEFVDVPCEKGEKEEMEFNKVDEQKLDLFMSSGSKTIENNKIKITEAICKVRVNSKRLDGDHLWSNESNNSPSFGSMRKEKEWRRTLACKLFEERHNSNNNNNNNNVVAGSEGMDMLWETYETEYSNNKQHLLAKSKKKKGKKGSKYEHDDDDDYEEEDEEEMDDNGKLCCLQALKFSTGKMNLGMGRPNLVKISKAFKGIGWLHNVTKHGKKIYH